MRIVIQYTRPRPAAAAAAAARGKLSTLDDGMRQGVREALIECVRTKGRSTKDLHRGRSCCEALLL